MKIIRLVVVVCLAYFASACELDQTEIIPNDDLRSEFLIVKSKTEILNDYQNLSIAGKKSLWVSKLNRVQGGNISEEQKTQIGELIVLLKEIEMPEDFYNEEIKKKGLSLASNMNRQDFIGTFASLYDYEILNEGSDVCDECIESFTNDWNNQKKIFRLASEDEPSCNCKWTCGGIFGPDVDCTTSTCESTSEGCGFLWFQTCEEREVVGECP